MILACMERSRLTIPPIKSQACISHILRSWKKDGKTRRTLWPALKLNGILYLQAILHTLDRSGTQPPLDRRLLQITHQALVQEKKTFQQNPEDYLGFMCLFEI